MLAKFKRVKKRAVLYYQLAKATGENQHSIQNNWFKKMFCSVPKNYIEITNRVLDSQIAYEKDSEELDEKLIIKHFGK